MTSQGGTKDWRQKVIQKVWEDEGFKKAFLEDANGALENLRREPGYEDLPKLPEGLKLKAVEETDEQIYFIIPSCSGKSLKIMTAACHW